ncbi:MAG: divergent PAP2 family protein [Patescibacteria group bacterium]|nr:divergent PAP2 family protein [Patescibacteria group bacterium]
MELPKILIASLSAGILTQLFKFFREAYYGRVQWSLLNSYGGMPSAHTAFVSALTASVCFSEGIDSPAFAISFILSAIIARDAIGFRRYLGTHGRVINMLMRELPDGEALKYPPQLRERVGHTPLEALVGMIIGISIAAIFYLLIY